jgi:hypothetical protein
MHAKPAEQARRIRTLHAIHAVLGLFLIAGGILKIAAAGIGTPGVGISAFMSVVFSIAEVLGGLWMVGGYDPERTRPWVVAAFVGLWATSAFQAVTGKCSCGCFGNLPVNPWLVTLFDLAAVVVLLKWDSAGKGNTDLLGSPRRILDLSAVACAMIVVGSLTQPPLSLAGAATLGGRPLKNVDLEVRSETFLSTIQTDEDGFFVMPRVRPGIYAITLFGRGTLLDPMGMTSTRPPIVRTQRKMTAKQKKTFVDARKKAEQAGIADDAATIWLDLSACTGDDLKVEYK